jgi:hypothetical protein
MANAQKICEIVKGVKLGLPGMVRQVLYQRTGNSVPIEFPCCLSHMLPLPLPLNSTIL